MWFRSYFTVSCSLSCPLSCLLSCPFISISIYLVHFLFHFFSLLIYRFTFLLLSSFTLSMAMVLITSGQAIRIFYHQSYNKRKAEELLKAIENIHTEIFYRDDPTKPLLLYKNIVFIDPINNHTYINEIEATDVIQINIREFG